MLVVSICWVRYPAMRSSILEKPPDSSDAFTMLMYRGEKTLGYRMRASENCLPLSTSFFIWTSIPLNLGFCTWSAMPSIAARMLMPARIMTESCAVKLCTSLAPGPQERLVLRIEPLRYLSSTEARERMYSPRLRSSWDAAARLAALSRPAVTFPEEFLDS